MEFVKSRGIIPPSALADIDIGRMRSLNDRQTRRISLDWLELDVAVVAGRNSGNEVLRFEGRLAGKGEQGARGGALAANAHIVDRLKSRDGAA